MAGGRHLPPTGPCLEGLDIALIRRAVGLGILAIQQEGHVFCFPSIVMTHLEAF